MEKLLEITRVTKSANLRSRTVLPPNGIKHPPRNWEPIPFDDVNSAMTHVVWVWWQCNGGRRGSDRLIFRSSPQSIPSHSLTHSFTWPPVAGPDDIDERRMKTRSLFSPPTNRASRMVVARLRELAHACWVRFTSTWATPF